MSTTEMTGIYKKSSQVLRGGNPRRCKERRVVYQGGKKRRYNRFAYELVAFPPSIDFSCT